ncbi:MAG: hypothetical protein AAGD00_06020 [Planctomycetota bacterium]
MNRLLQQGIEGRTARLGERAGGKPITPTAPTSTPGQPGGLSDIGGLLRELRSLVADATDGGREQIDAARTRIDGVLKDIDGVLESRGDLPPERFPIVPRRVSDGLTIEGVRADLRYPQLPEGGVRSEVEFVDPGQNGTLFLGLGSSDDGLDLESAASSFVLTVLGNEGARQLSFASGTSLNSFITAINSFETETGVRASLASVEGSDEQFVKLESTVPGDNAFAGVIIADSGGIDATGIYSADPDDPSQLGALRSDFKSATANPILDLGIDAQALVDGVPATYGNGRFRSQNTEVSFTFRLDFANATPGQTYEVLFSQPLTTGPDDIDVPPTLPTFDRLSSLIDSILSGERDLGDLSRAIEDMLDRLGNDRPGTVLDQRA